MVPGGRFLDASDVIYTFPAIRGVQAGREYYVAMCPLRTIPRIFLDEEEIPAELRAQRILNHARIPEIAQYIIENPKDYVFSSITASVDGEVQFEPVEMKGHLSKFGTLKIPMTARFVINDGQHRRAAIEEALKEKPKIGLETISVVFFVDGGLRRSQQMFADLNKHAVRPTKSLGVLYDHRDQLACLVKQMISVVPIFKGLTELEKTTISNRSNTLFTLNGIYQATRSLLRKRTKQARVTDQEGQLATEYWTEVTKHVPEWRLLIQHKVTSSELRSHYILAHGLALHALGIVGETLIRQHPDDWKSLLGKLVEVDWSRSNTKLWEGRAMIGGRISKAQRNLVLTTNLLKQVLDLPLTVEEEKAEQLFLALRVERDHNGY